MVEGAGEWQCCSPALAHVFCSRATDAAPLHPSRPLAYTLAHDYHQATDQLEESRERGGEWRPARRAATCLYGSRMLLRITIAPRTTSGSGAGIQRPALSRSGRIARAARSSG